MYRELYGEVEECKKYVEDKNHKTFAWKEYPFSIIFENKTNYHLKIWKKKKIGANVIRLAPKQKIEVIFYDRDEEIVEVKTIEAQLKCCFKICKGIMAEREWIKKRREVKEYLVPIFYIGKIELIVFENPEPNLGNVPQYTITPLKVEDFDTMRVLVKNCLSHDVLFSITENILTECKSGEEKEIVLPRNGIVYIDTKLEEIVYENPYSSNDLEKRKILRVNGCCFEIQYGKVVRQHTICGPVLEEPYIRYLYVDCEKEKEITKLKVRCWTVDWRLE